MLGEAFAAGHRPVARRLKGNFALFLAIRADCFAHLSWAAVKTSSLESHGGFTSFLFGSMLKLLPKKSVLSNKNMVEYKKAMETMGINKVQNGVNSGHSNTTYETCRTRVLDSSLTRISRSYPIDAFPF